MKIEITKIKQYCSTNKFVISVDGSPFCIVRGIESTNKIASALSGNNEDIKDGTIERKIRKINEEKKQ